MTKKSKSKSLSKKRTKAKVITEKPKGKSPLNNFPAIISGLWVLTLVSSIVYDYAFFSSLGTNFSEMPTTLPDHLRSSIIWIPLAITTLTPILLWSVIVMTITIVYAQYWLRVSEKNIKNLDMRVDGIGNEVKKVQKSIKAKKSTKKEIAKKYDN